MRNKILHHKKNFSLVCIFLFSVCIFPLSAQSKKKTIPRKKNISAQKADKEKNKSIFEQETVKKPKSESTVLRWSPVAFVKYYILEIKNRRGKILVKKQLTTTSYKFFTSKEGIYYYRLSFINRMERMELQSSWKKFEVIKVRIPEVYSLDPNELFPRTPYEIEMLGKNFNSRNKLVALQVFKEKKKEKGGVVVTERLGNPIPLKHKVESEEKIKINIPPKLFSTGNYKMSMLFRNKPLYISPYPIFSVEPQKFISRLYVMPSYYYINQSKTAAAQNFLLNMGFGMDIRWGTRLFKNKMEVGFAGGFYFFTPSEDGKSYIKVSGMLPFGGYIGYNGEIRAKGGVSVHFMPYVDMGFDLYMFNFLDKYKESIEKNVIGVPKMNIGVMFMVEKKKLLFSMGVATSFGIAAKKFIFSGVIANVGLGIRLEFIPKKKGE